MGRTRMVLPMRDLLRDVLEDACYLTVDVVEGTVQGLLDRKWLIAFLSVLALVGAGTGAAVRHFGLTGTWAWTVDMAHVWAHNDAALGITAWLVCGLLSVALVAGS